MVEQRELEDARPCPELADRERRDRLEGADEPLQALRVESAGARSDQFERERVDAGKPGEIVGRNAGKPPEEAGWKIVMDVACGGGDDVEVVEQPFGSRRHAFLAVVLGERCVDVSQHTHVCRELPEMGVAAAAALRADREQRRQAPGVLFQQFDAEQFLAISQRARARECTTHALIPLR